MRRVETVGDMMFDRYKKSFFLDDSGDETAGPLAEPEVPVLDVPFDQKLKRSIVGKELDELYAAEAMSETPETPPQDVADPPAETAKPVPEEAVKPVPAQAAKPVPEEAVTPVPADVVKPTPEEVKASAEALRELRVLSAWQHLKPVWRRQQNTAQRLRNHCDEVKTATDALRTQVLQKMKTEGWTRIAVTAPTSGCGTTFTTLNLALSISAIPDVKTVLLDLNQRTPGIEKALDTQGAQAISDLLSGKVPVANYLRRYGDNLAVGLNAEATPNPAEILQSRRTESVLNEIDAALSPDVMLCDMPPLLEYDDMIAFLPLVDCILLVADGTKTLGTQIAECEKMLEGKAPVMGVVLNRGRRSRK